MLTKTVQTTHFLWLRSNSAKTSTIVFFHQIAVQLLKCKYVSFVLREQLNVVFEHRNGDMPQVKIFCHKLENFRLYSNLGLLKTHYLFEHGPRKQSFDLWRQCASVFNQVLGHFVEIGWELNVFLALQNLFPNLPENLAEDLLCYVFVMAVLWINPNYLRQWWKHVF